MGVMYEVMRAGDTRLEWDPNNTAEVDAARTMFSSLTARGYSAFRTDADGEQQGKRLTAFDPQAEHIVMVPAIAGG